MSNRDNPNLIQCGNHQWAPWSIVCVHLMEGTSREWQGMHSTNPEVDYDWLCPDCMAKFIAEGDEEQQHDITDLRPICIHCVRYLRRRFDRNFHG